MMEMNKCTLKKAVKVLCQNNKALAYYLKQFLHESLHADDILTEGEVVEVTYNNITVSFTWDYITCVDNLTNNVCHLTSDYYEVVKVFQWGIWKMKKLFVVYHVLDLYSNSIKTRTYFRAKDYKALINYLSEIHFNGLGTITQIKKLKRIYRKTDIIKEI